ncbi:MAG TPA: arsenate reductase ArsC [Bacteroidales bacterium]|nr:arsenate reductase ArsC [Bacteroidales bacterium]
MQVLIVGTQNSARSQMAHAWLAANNSEIEVYSAGVTPSNNIPEEVISSMKEIGIDLTGQEPKAITEYLDKKWDIVISVSEEARDQMPTFTKKVRHKLHKSFIDTELFTGTTEEKREKYALLRDEIVESFYSLNEAIVMEIEAKKYAHEDHHQCGCGGSCGC